jgi:hypothetical protein
MAEGSLSGSAARAIYCEKETKTRPGLNRTGPACHPFWNKSFRKCAIEMNGPQIREGKSAEWVAMIIAAEKADRASAGSESRQGQRGQ